MPYILKRLKNGLTNLPSHTGCFYQFNLGKQPVVGRVGIYDDTIDLKKCTLGLPDEVKNGTKANGHQLNEQNRQFGKHFKDCYNSMNALT